MSDRIVAQTELRKKLGQLLYLNNLAKVRPFVFFSNANYTLSRMNSQHRPQALSLLPPLSLRRDTLDSTE